MNRLQVALVAGALSTSCVPVPHRAFRTPIIYGTLTGPQSPVAGMPVRVVAEPAQNSPCAGSHAPETQTDAKGTFRLCPLPDFQWLLYPMAHKRLRWNVCANVQGTWTLLRESSRYTLGDTGPREIEQIECSIDSAEVRCRQSSDIDLTPDKIRAALGQQQCAGVPVP